MISRQDLRAESSLGEKSGAWKASPSPGASSRSWRVRARSARRRWCRYSGQILSYNKMLGQLHDAGNTTTLARYLDLLEHAGMVRGLPKYAGEVVRRRASSPKLQVFNTALMSAQAGLTFDDARKDRAYWGRLVESAVGAYLANAAAAGTIDLHYWRHRGDEIDFVVTSGSRLVGIEVKSAGDGGSARGRDRFREAFDPDRVLVVGPTGIPLERFLSEPLEAWLGSPDPYCVE